MNLIDTIYLRKRKKLHCFNCYYWDMDDDIVDVPTGDCLLHKGKRTNDCYKEKCDYLVPCPPGHVFDCPFCLNRSSFKELEKDYEDKDIKRITMTICDKCGIIFDTKVIGKIHINGGWENED